MLKIRPTKFQVDSMEVGQVSQLNLDLDKRDVALAVEASKAGANAVDIKFKLRVKLEDELGLALVYRVQFEALDPDVENFEVTEDSLQDKFYGINAPAIGYPFLRAFLSTFCVNAGFKVHMLPPLNFQQIYDQKTDRKAGAIAALEGTQSQN